MRSKTSWSCFAPRAMSPSGGSPAGRNGSCRTTRDSFGCRRRDRRARARCPGTPRRRPRRRRARGSSRWRRRRSGSRCGRRRAAPRARQRLRARCPPRGRAARHGVPSLSSRTTPLVQASAGQVVEDDVEAHPRRRAVGRRIPEERRREAVAASADRYALDQSLSALGVGRLRAERRRSRRRVLLGDPVHAAGRRVDESLDAAFLARFARRTEPWWLTSYVIVGAS